MNKEKLKEYFKSLGLDTVGITGVNVNYELEKKLKERIEKEHITGMEEPILENRINPKNIMKDAKSIIVCAFPYHIDNEKESNLSRYCRGLDYHIVAKELLQKVCDYLDENIEGFEYKIFVDNGPLVDRELAYLSGIGYFGINNNIITDKYGSYVFIGYIINNYEFSLDKPLDKECMKCGKCVKYCPGNALLGNYDMNPRKCLSYITQKKEELSLEEVKAIKNSGKIFGCDICQEVCPHNKNIKETHIEEFMKDLILNLDFEEIDEISNKEFKRRYGNRAFSWRGKKIIKRNIEIILEKS
ncbi:MULTISPECIES: tRNA epoxyqueuosine(34) reductase QueG [Romboutsia]|uniref:Epoxyqueuosine reductase n=1 Tax=Romboutsia hominis TaxID=1507512 RepID=A0A2P2BUJ8_9FIRM|nr:MULTISPECIES: tRNA epoxyqueuosine(34) reductase QueG [Romboutsia]MCH1959141.1 tRNA epoxyqueuosine(34) reductase QueG [Romboutsia hominis]MCH1968261.1 tRNA epoxyqueuosine(34) reductase QueG [Romboutsia hominis]MDB8789506.1 tRNA epoxyqueuosine(34) reductase QueG [Romboutsia sp. 1001216sp1]MDB8793884.1 tRNA epoxyqueuosine(34) reductase QueG [Romboutsia sp. 1001216sp1]MDB8796657.1 tRNA epoxyqueuosine(34) reductase QueG [Romboutsia sp. 1001216sp1]